MRLVTNAGTPGTVLLLFVVLVLSNGCLTTALADVQMPKWGLPTGNQPQNTPGLPIQQVPQMAPAVPDTVVGALVISDEFPEILSVSVLPDTVTFGARSYLVIDVPEAADLTKIDIDSLAQNIAWLDPVHDPEPGFVDRLLGKVPAEADLSRLPNPAGSRVVFPVRIYRPHPFVVEAGANETQVIHVLGLAEGLEQTAAIRDPRVRSWDFWLIGIAALVLALSVLLGLWLWGRRTVAAAISEDWAMPQPAWILSAVELQELLQDGTLARGDGRLFLDGLAAVTRQYVARRYRIAAREMTGQEIMIACKGLGHVLDQPRNFAQLIDAADCCRYDPDSPDLNWCRAKAFTLFKGMRNVRVIPEQTPVEADQLIRAQKAWAELENQLGSNKEELLAVNVGSTTTDEEVS